jgi:hypothetical protein
MREIIIIVLIIIFYAFASYKVYRILVKSGKITFLLFCLLYLILTYVFFELINQLEIYLRGKQIYLEFGHADILMLQVMAACFLIAFITIIFTIIRRVNQN